jgi:large subunit ribosomal protein L21
MIRYASRNNIKMKMMYAIVEIAGQQFKVEEGKKIFVHRLDIEEGKKIEFDQVLLIEDEGKITIGEPVIKDAVIEGKVLDHLRGDKVIVFKKKRKKGYRIKNGHRQNFTHVEIVSINGKSSGKRKAAEKVPVEVAAETAPEPVKVKKAETKKVVKKAETAEKKPAVKKPAVVKTKKTKE